MLDSNISMLKRFPFGKYPISWGNIPNTYTEALTYEEQILWLCQYITLTLIPSINEDKDAIIEIQNFLNALDIEELNAIYDRIKDLNVPALMERLENDEGRITILENKVNWSLETITELTNLVNSFAIQLENATPKIVFESAEGQTGTCNFNRNITGAKKVRIVYGKGNDIIGSVEVTSPMLKTIDIYVPSIFNESTATLYEKSVTITPNALLVEQTHKMPYTTGIIEESEDIIQIFSVEVYIDAPTPSESEV